MQALRKAIGLQRAEPGSPVAPTPKAQRPILGRILGTIYANCNIYVVGENVCDAARLAAHEAVSKLALKEIPSDQNVIAFIEEEIEATANAALVRIFPPAKPLADATLHFDGWCSVKLWLGPKMRLEPIRVQFVVRAKI